MQFISVQVLVAGGPGAGKTTFIRSASGPTRSPTISRARPGVNAIAA